MKKTGYTRWISTALKVAIVLLASVYIVRRLAVQPNAAGILAHIAASFYASPFRFLLVLLLMPVNWMIESLKWKLLVSRSGEKLSFSEAVKGVLAGVTTGTATPNRVGEFAGRIFMLKDRDRVGLLLLTFVAGFCQVTVTVLAGLWGLLLYVPVDELSWHFSKYERMYLWLLPPLMFGAIVFFLAFIRQRNIRVPRIPMLVFLQTLGLSALRYAVYVLQFVLLLSLVAPALNWKMATACVSVCYLLVTVLPTFSLTEVLVRGSVAGIVFSAMPLVSDEAVYVAILLWLINVATPSLLGSVFVFRLKFFRNSSAE